MRTLGLILRWEDTIGGTKRGLYQLFQAVVLIAKKQDEIISKLNELEKKQSIEIITKFEKGQPTMYSVDGGENYEPKEQFEVNQLLLKARRSELEQARELIPNYQPKPIEQIQGKTAANEYLKRRIAELDNQIQEGTE